MPLMWCRRRSPAHIPHSNNNLAGIHIQGPLWEFGDLDRSLQDSKGAQDLEGLFWEGWTVPGGRLTNCGPHYGCGHSSIPLWTQLQLIWPWFYHQHHLPGTWEGLHPPRSWVTGLQNFVPIIDSLVVCDSAPALLDHGLRAVLTVQGPGGKHTCLCF